MAATEMISSEQSNVSGGCTGEWVVVGGGSMEWCAVLLRSQHEPCIGFLPDMSSIFANMGVRGNSAIRCPTGSVS